MDPRRSPASARPRARTKKPICSRSWCAPALAPTTSITARGYATLAPWCVGRRGLLVSATPAVNRLEDVAHQLLLFVRDDALGWSGVASLRRGLAGRGEALAHLIVTGEDRSE